MILQGDCRDVLATLPAESVHCCVTSPPYWGLRDYGVDGQLGMEPTPEEYVANMVAVFREVRRVLREDGTLWLNLGDSYAGSGKGPSNGAIDGAKPHRGMSRIDVAPSRWISVPQGIKPKDLVGIPWRVAFALQADGWWLRSDIIWAKGNPMPESVTDRPTKAHEYLFLLSKSERYFYDADAIREPHATPPEQRVTKHGRNALRGQEAIRPRGNLEACDNPEDRYYAEGGRNARSVWTINTRPFPEAHFAVFPEELPRRCIKAGTSERGCCPECGAPWMRVVERTPMVLKRSERGEQMGEFGRTQTSGTMVQAPPSRTTGWEPSCEHEGEPVPCTVLDPFNGAGTTGLVAQEHGRKYIGIELNPEYIEIAERRTAQGTLWLDGAA